MKECPKCHKKQMGKPWIIGAPENELWCKKCGYKEKVKVKE